MKKKYIRPTVEVEHFVLTQVIAACHPSYIVHSLSSKCVEDSNNATDKMRDWAAAGLWIDTTHCDWPAEGMPPEDGICYHTNMNAVFRS